MLWGPFSPPPPPLPSTRAPTPSPSRTHKLLSNYFIACTMSHIFIYSTRKGAFCQMPRCTEISHEMCKFLNDSADRMCAVINLLRSCVVYLFVCFVFLVLFSALTLSVTALFLMAHIKWSNAKNVVIVAICRDTFIIATPRSISFFPFLFILCRYSCFVGGGCCCRHRCRRFCRCLVFIQSAFHLNLLVLTMQKDILIKKFLIHIELIRHKASNGIFDAFLHTHLNQK